MITKDTRSILKNLIPINNSMIVEPVMHGTDEFKGITFRANLDIIEDDIQEFGIFDMSSFLNSLDLLEDADVSLDGNRIIAQDKDSKLEFITTDPSALEDVAGNPRVIDSTLNANSAIEFNFGSEMLNRIKKASGVFKTFDTLFVLKNGNDVSLKMGTKDTYNKSNNSFAISVDTTLATDKDFEIALPIESLLKIPAVDYNFIVKYNEEKDIYRVVVQNDILVFVMSLSK